MPIVNRCTGIDGCALSPLNRQLLKAMLAGADRYTWRRARRMIICAAPLTTLGMAVHRVSSHNLLADTVPDPFTVYRALRLTLDGRGRLQKASL
jgi:hypothetical protein